MFFTKTAKILASLGLLGGTVRFLTALGVAMEFLPPGAIRRYLGSGTAAEHIDRGLYVMFCSIVLGVIVEISEGVRRSRAESGNAPLDH